MERRVIRCVVRLRVGIACGDIEKKEKKPGVKQRKIGEKIIFLSIL